MRHGESCPQPTSVAAVEAASMGKKRSNANYRRTIVRPPYLDHSKLAVLNSFCSPASCRVCQSAIDQFIAWYCSEARLACNPIVVVRYRMQLDGRGLAPTRSTSNWLRFEASHTKPPTPNVEPRAGCWDSRVKRREAGRQRSGDWLSAERSFGVTQACTAAG